MKSGKDDGTLGGGLLHSFSIYIRIKRVPIPGGPIFQSPKRNIGWRIDYFIVSERFKENILDSKIDSHVLGSDHCP